MRSEKQREASRINGAKSRGPTSPEGKNVSKFNGVTHGLCAVHLILPGEDPAALDAEFLAWDNDWNPQSHTRAVLVRRAAIASWRLNRAVKAEAAWLGRRAELAGDAFDFERFNRADRAVSRAATDPGGALCLLEMDATRASTASSPPAASSSAPSRPGRPPGTSRITTSGSCS